MKEIFYIEEHLRTRQKFKKLSKIFKKISTEKEVINYQKSMNKLTKKKEIRIIVECILVVIHQFTSQAESLLRNFRFRMFQNFL